MSDDVQREMDRLADVIVPYLCERTGLSSSDVESVLEAQEDFWTNQPHVIGRMYIFGFPATDEDE